MVVQTFPLIGNYGVNPKDFESKGIHMSAYITREWCPCPSNFRCQMDLDAFLKQQNVPGIYDLDTRCLTKLIRERGVMNGLKELGNHGRGSTRYLQGTLPDSVPASPSSRRFVGLRCKTEYHPKAARIKLRLDHRSRFHDSSTHPLLFAGRYHVEQWSRQPEG